MRKRFADIYDFRASDGLNPIVMQKLNTNFWNLLDMFEDPEIVMVSQANEPLPRTDETLWYETDTGTLHIWSKVSDDPEEWDWVSATDVVINDEHTVELITSIAQEAGDKNMVFYKEEPSTIWSIWHTLNKRPSITIVTDEGLSIEASVTYGQIINDELIDDERLVTLRFYDNGTPIAVSGRAYLN